MTKEHSYKLILNTRLIDFVMNSIPIPIAIMLISKKMGKVQLTCTNHQRNGSKEVKILIFWSDVFAIQNPIRTLILLDNEGTGLPSVTISWGHQ